MHRLICLVALAASAFIPARAQDVVFRSDVSLVRVDAQVLDRNNRAITGLHVEDFILREQGNPQEIRNFASENMPADILFLIDVSASMRPHVERVSEAAHQAMQILGQQDRVAIMVFDRSTRVRMPFTSGREEVERGFQALLRQETFNGGTDITRALLDAANYIGRSARREARRAIVILTDDQTERDRDEARVLRALTSAETVLSALIAPDAMHSARGLPRGGGQWPSGGGGGGWPGGGGLPGVILGRRRGPYGGRGGNGPVVMGPRTQSAGTSEIARQSGGDSMPVDDASALETTLARIRQRYALYFYLPEGVKAGQERNIEVSLAASALRRYPDADVRYRRVYMAPGAGGDTAPAAETETTTISQEPGLRRRRTVNPGAAPDSSSQDGGWRRVEGFPEHPAEPAPNSNGSSDPEPQQGGGWRRVKPGEQP